MSIKNTINRIGTALVLVFLMLICLSTAVLAGRLQENTVQEENLISVRTGVTLSEIKLFDDKLIEPGSSGECTFTIRNSGSAVSYNLYMTTDVTAENNGAVTELPVVISLSKGADNYLTANGAAGVSESTLREESGETQFESEARLASGGESTYTINWEWPYYISDEKDIEDTAIGNSAVLGDIDFTVNIKVVAEVDTDEITDENVPEVVEKVEEVEKELGIAGETVPDKILGLLPETGETNALIMWSIIVLACVAGVIILIIFAIRRRTEK